MNQADWDTHIPKALFAYQTAVHGFTPFLLLFGHTPNLPVDIMLGQQPSVSNSRGTISNIVVSTRKHMENMFSVVRHRSLSAQKKQKQLYDRGSKRFSTRWVREYVPAIPKGSTKKLASPWRGPYTIIDKTSDVNYKIQLIGGSRQSVVQVNQLKPCFGEPDQLLVTDGTLPRWNLCSGNAGYTTIEDQVVTDSEPIPISNRNSRTQRARQPPPNSMVT